MNVGVMHLDSNSVVKAPKTEDRVTLVKIIQEVHEYTRLVIEQKAD
jgi:hypothetical protein